MDKTEKQKKQQALVVKDNDLIQKKSFDFSELELKCINYAITKMYDCDNLKEGTLIDLPLNELCEILEIDLQNNNYLHLRNAMKNIEDKSKIVKLEDGWDTNFRFFLRTYGNEEKGIVKVSFFHELIEKVQNLKGHFTSFQLLNTLKIKRKYGIRLYELCKSYENYYNDYYKAKGVFDIQINDLIEQWCIPTKKSNPEIDRDIIKPSVKEINEKTDIIVDYVRQKGKNAKIKFKVKPKEQILTPSEELKNEEQAIKKNYERIVQAVEQGKQTTSTPISVECNIIEYAIEHLHGFTKSQIKLLNELKAKLNYEVLTYLLDYCIENNKTTTKYIETIANDWIERGITTREQAQQLIEDYKKHDERKKARIVKKRPLKANFKQRNTDYSELEFFKSKNGIFS